MNSKEFQEIKNRAIEANSGAIHKVWENQWDDIHAVQIPDKTGQLHFPDEAVDCELFAHAKADILTLTSFLESLANEDLQTIADKIHDLFSMGKYSLCIHWNYIDSPEEEKVVTIYSGKKFSDENMSVLFNFMSNADWHFQEYLKNTPTTGIEMVLKVLGYDGFETVVTNEDNENADNVCYLPVLAYKG